MDTIALLILALVIAWTILYGSYRLALYVVELDLREAGPRRKHMHGARRASTRPGV